VVLWWVVAVGWFFAFFLPRRSRKFPDQSSRLSDAEATKTAESHKVRRFALAAGLEVVFGFVSTLWWRAFKADYRYRYSPNLLVRSGKANRRNAICAFAFFDIKRSLLEAPSKKTNWHGGEMRRYICRGHSDSSHLCHFRKWTTVWMKSSESITAYPAIWGSMQIYDYW